MNLHLIFKALPIVLVSQAVLADGFLESSKGVISSRTLYFEGDQRQGGTDQRQTATGLRFDFLSGYTPGSVGLGLDVVGLLGLGLGGGISQESSSTVNTITPVTRDGSPVDQWTRVGANLKFRVSKTELKVGNALTPRVPVLVANDSRVLPAHYQGVLLSSKDLANMTINAGYLNREIGRASSNWAGIAAGGRRGADVFSFAGVDWTPIKNLTLQYYFAKLDDYYDQNYLGAIYVHPLGKDRSIKADLRYFNSRSDGRNGSNPNFALRNGYNAGNLGEVDNDTWSLAFAYLHEAHSFTIGHQRVSDSGGMAAVNNGSVVDGRGRPEGEGGTSYYLYTDININSFTRAGENSTFGIYKYDFSKSGVPGLSAGITYISGRDIRGVGGSNTNGRYSEWERDLRVDYLIPSGPLKGLEFSLRRANYRTELPQSTSQDQDQTRIYVTYNYALW